MNSRRLRILAGTLILATAASQNSFGQVDGTRQVVTSKPALAPRTNTETSPRTTAYRIRHDGPHLSAQHPLVPVIETARQKLAYLEQNVHDYTCYLVKRERIDGELMPSEHMLVKFRDEQRINDELVTPFSVYLKYLAPKRSRGREVLFVTGRNDGDLLVNSGRRGRSLTLSLSPEGGLARRDNRYPITAFGLRNLVDRLLQIAEHDLQFEECQVKVYRGAKVDNRVCTTYEVIHPERRGHFYFHKARVFLDDALQVPIRYAAYDWPEVPGEDPPLLEEYTYRKLRLNVGLSNADFDRSNPQYTFSPAGPS